MSVLETVAAGVRAAADDAMTDVNAVQSTPFASRTTGSLFQEWQYEVRSDQSVVIVSIEITPEERNAS
jgi:hypothetical protein